MARCLPIPQGAQPHPRGGGWQNPKRSLDYPHKHPNLCVEGQLISNQAEQSEPQESAGTASPPLRASMPRAPALPSITLSWTQPEQHLHEAGRAGCLPKPGTHPRSCLLEISSPPSSPWPFPCFILPSFSTSCVSQAH